MKMEKGTYIDLSDFINNWDDIRKTYEEKCMGIIPPTKLKEAKQLNFSLEGLIDICQKQTILDTPITSSIKEYLLLLKKISEYMSDDYYLNKLTQLKNKIGDEK